MKCAALLKTLAAVVLLFAASTAFAQYDPLSISGKTPASKTLSVNDKKRSREIPIRVYLPATKKPAPVVLFSHGLGGSRNNSPYLGNHWAARGYVVVFVQHPGSDESVWKDKPQAERMADLRRAASVDNFRLRNDDIHAVLDQLEIWNRQRPNVVGCPLDLQRIGMSGHSFGAITTQAVSGQAFPLGLHFTDSRIKAAVAMSPSPPRLGDTGKAFGNVQIPWMLLTGTLDDSPLGDTSAAGRLTVFAALPPGDKYELVLDKAAHSAFGDRKLPMELVEHKPNHHRAILAVTTAFWDAYLKGDAQAKRWLESDAVRKTLEPADRWEKK